MISSTLPLWFIQRVFKAPYLLLPSISVKDISCINFEKLKAVGIRAICFDKDNVLTEPLANELHPPLNETWQKCHSIFQGRMAVLSNSAGSADDLGYKQAILLEKNLNVPVIRHKDKKPEGGESIVRHFQIPPFQIAMIGDRILTDILMGNLDEMFTIHTKPLNAKEDTATVQIVRPSSNDDYSIKIRKIENRIVKRIRPLYENKSPIHPHRYYHPSIIENNKV